MFEKSARCLQRHRAAVPDSVVSVPAIVESRERAAPSAAETAAVLAGFKLGAETKIKLDVRAEQLASGISPDSAQPRSRRAVSQHRDSRAAISPAARTS
jgi:hypothetical protein